jgi:2OG-Fe(II) oxygenase superfamily
MWSTVVDEIVAALEALETDGSFTAEHTVPASALRLAVKGAGPIAFPLKPAAVQSLIEVAEPARFGWREKTLLDKKVRHCWEIPARRLKIADRPWNAALKRALDEIAIDLGLENAGRKKTALKAHLHNLLIYGPGQFFAAHQDSEKMQGMVATLTVLLPSPHDGGALIVDSHGQKRRFQGAPSRGKLSLIAFYADCYHELKPVRKGYRIALTYNLVLNGAKSADDPVATAFPAVKLKALLREYFASRDRNGKPKKWVYLLDNQYTQKGLSWKLLKNSDRLRASILRQTAELLGLDIHLALAEIEEVWDAYSEDDEYSSRHRYWESDEEDEDSAEESADSAADDNYVLQELIDGNVELRHWIDARGRPVRKPSVSVYESEMCWTRATDEFSPFKSEYEGYMGNYGNTLDRWYHRAVIVLTPRQKGRSAPPARRKK